MAGVTDPDRPPVFCGLAEVVGLPFAACAYEKVGGGDATSDPDLFVEVDIVASAANSWESASSV